MRKFIIHPGYAKTATTHLQKNLFSKIQHIDYLGKPFDDDMLMVNRMIQISDTYRYNECKDDLTNLLRKKITNSKKEILLFSGESFFCPGPNLEPLRPSTDIIQCIDRISDIFFDGINDIAEPHIVFTIRRQGDLLPSFFAQFGHRMTIKGIFAEDFNDFLNFCFNDRYSSFGYYFNYYEIYKRLTERFGQNRVSVIPMEALFTSATNKHQILLSNALGIETTQTREFIGKWKNKRSPSENDTKRYHIRRAKNHHLAYLRFDELSTLGLSKRALISRLNNMKIKLKIKPSDELRELNTFRVSKEQRDTITEMYASSNRNLSQVCDLRLNEFNYF